MGFRQIQFAEDHDMQHFLQPLTDMHFNASYDSFEYTAAHKPTLYGLLLLALFILLLACINFANLSTAASTERAKEISVRKTLGGRKSILMKFLTTSSLINSWLLFIKRSKNWPACSTGPLALLS